MVMKREHQWDMFDVAIGACDLDTYLHQRYSENDLQSKFWVEPSDAVDELRPPTRGSKEPVVIPVQRPRASIEPERASPLPSRPPWEKSPEKDDHALPHPSPSSHVASRPTPPWEAPQRPTPPRDTASAQPLPSRTAEPLVERQGPLSVSSQEPVLRSLSLPHDVDKPESKALEPSATPGPPPPMSPQSMAELLAKFHEATKAYDERAKGTDTVSQEQ